jgi:hypothetical protein
MGLLDDAIREHLELKRRHGADPQEVDRQEQEVLGEARRRELEAEAEATAAVPFDAAGEEADVPEPEGPPEFDERAVAPEPGDRTRVYDEQADAAEPVDEVVAPPEPEAPAPGEEAAAPGYDEDPWLDEERDEVPSEESLDRPAGEEPREPLDRSAGEEEDVLEETPDFLQETPEHDRLWFEQRPPRDFDWDK